MTNIIDLADYRDVTPREDEIRLPEDGFVLRGLHMIELGGLVEAHKWLSLAALRGSARARTERIKLTRRMSSADVAAAQQAMALYIRSTRRVAG
jgi:TPR repeat protein